MWLIFFSEKKNLIVTPTLTREMTCRYQFGRLLYKIKHTEKLVQNFDNNIILKSTRKLKITKQFLKTNAPFSCFYKPSTRNIDKPLFPLNIYSIYLVITYETPININKSYSQNSSIHYCKQRESLLKISYISQSKEVKCDKTTQHYNKPKQKKRLHHDTWKEISK